MARQTQAGYRKPPKDKQFRPGKSGNPKGRPKGSLNLTTVLSAELSERVTVRENGKAQRVSKQTALIKTLIAKALQGDVKSIATILMLSGRLVDERSPDDHSEVPVAELRELKRYAGQLLKQVKGRRR